MSFVKKSLIIAFSIFALILVSQVISKQDNQTLYARGQESGVLIAQSDTAVFVPERLKYYKEQYEATYKANFEIVWNSVKETLDEMKCHYLSPSFRVDSAGFYIGSITTEDWVFSEGTDSTFELINRYGLDVPQIPGAIWITGRLAFKIRIRQIDDQTIFISFKTKMSGREDSSTQQVHYWKSNGLLELAFLERVDAKMQAFFKENN